MNRAIKKAIAPTLLLICLIFILSSTPYSLQNIRPLLSDNRMEAWLTHWLHNVHFSYQGQEVSVRTMGAPALAEFFLRKGAHLLLFACLGYCFMIALYKLTAWRLVWIAIIAFASTVMYALFDEFYQSFIPLRTSSIVDVGIDMVGAFIGIILFSVKQKMGIKWVPSKGGILKRRGDPDEEVG